MTVKQLIKTIFFAFPIIYSLNSNAETQTFIAKVYRLYTFTESYYPGWEDKAQIQFEGQPITLAGCNTSHVAIPSSNSENSNGSALYSTALAAFVSGKPLQVSIRNDSHLIGDHCMVRWITIIP